MKLFRKRSGRAAPELVQAQRACDPELTLPAAPAGFENELYDRLRTAVPVIDAAIQKMIRLTGGFRLVCDDEGLQPELDRFCESVPVGLTGRSLGTFADNFLDRLLTYGRAVGEIGADVGGRRIAGLWNGDTAAVRVVPGADPFQRKFLIRSRGKVKEAAHPERILYAELPGGHSILRGLPSVSRILLRIYQCIGQNFDRCGNVRYAVTYKPAKDSGDFAYSRERAGEIARQWADGMSSAKYGQVKDFVAVGDVDIKVIGAENQLIDTNVPVRQLMEQIVSKLSIPPFLLGLNWSSTERMSAQQADILTSELEYYRRLLTPVLTEIGEDFLCSIGSTSGCRVEWENINLQDEEVLAEARLKNAQAREIEARLESAGALSE